jgi:hypothetical protein
MIRRQENLRWSKWKQAKVLNSAEQMAVTFDATASKTLVPVKTGQSAPPRPSGAFWGARLAGCHHPGAKTERLAAARNGPSSRRSNDE